MCAARFDSSTEESHTQKEGAFHEDRRILSTTIFTILWTSWGARSSELRIALAAAIVLAASGALTQKAPFTPTAISKANLSSKAERTEHSGLRSLA